MSIITPIAPRLFAVFIGLAVPSLFFGRSVLAVMIGLALICLLLTEERFEHWRRGLSRLHTPLGYLILLTFAGWLPNVLVSLDPLRSFEAAARTLLIIGALTGVWSAFNSNEKLIDIALKALIVMSAITVVIAVLSMTVWPELFWVLKLRGVQSTRVFTEMKPFASLSALVIPVLIWTAFRLPLRWSVLSVIGIAGFLAAVWLSYDRAAIAGIIGAVICVAIAIASRGRSLKRALPMIIVAIALIVVTLIWLKSTRMLVRGPGVVDWFAPIWLLDFERQTMWIYAWEMMKQSPWFGLGINTINLVSGTEAIMPGTRALEMIPGHPHNWLIEVWAETGIVGLLPLLTTIAASFWIALQRFRADIGDDALVSLAVFAGYWASGLFNFSYWSVWWQASFFLIAVLGLSLKSRPKPHAPL